MVPGTFTCLKWSLVPPHFKVLYKMFMKSVQIFNKKVPPVKSEVLVQVKNIENPVFVFPFLLCKSEFMKFCPSLYIY